MRVIFTLVLVVFMGFESFGQNSFFAVQDGAWNQQNTWDCGGCGENTPDGNDDVYTEGFVVRVTNNQSVNNLYVAYNVANGINKTLGNASLTINGQLASYDPATFDYATPTTNIVNNTASSWLIQFTGAGLSTATDPVIFSWSSSAPLRSISFNPSSSSTTLYTNGFAVSNGGSVVVANGTLELNSGQAIQLASGATSGAITVNSGTSMNINGTIIGNSGPTSLFPTINVNGTLTSGSVSYLNSATFVTSSTAILNIGFNAADQTEGWWYQNNAPTTLTIDPASTVVYNANANQNVYAYSYGNLTISSSTSATKTIVGSGNLDVTGTFSIPSAGVSLVSTNTNPKSFSGNISVNGNWTSGQLVLLENGNAQSISGTGTIAWDGGLEVNKSAATATLNKNVSVSNGLTITQGTLNMGSFTLTLSGNLINNGTLSADPGASGGTLLINGTTAISGANAPTLSNLTISSSGNLTAPAGTISLTGNLTNSGTFNRNGGTILMTGTSPTTVNGTISLHNLTINNTNGVSLEGSANVHGTVTLGTGGVFDADGTGAGVLTLRSTGLSTSGSIATLPDPDLFSGDVTVQRYIDDPEDWRYLAVPVTNASLNQWRDDFPVTGSFSDASPVGGNVVSSTAPSVYFYNAGTQAWVPASAASTSAFALNNLVGYSAWTYLSTPVSVGVRGTIGKGPRTITLANSWNLIPNPYPSSIDWDLVSIGGSLVTNTIYVRTSNGVFATYLQGSGLGSGHPATWAGEVALGQSFWVEANGAGSITMTEAAKTGSFRFVREDQPDNYVRIQLHKGAIVDEAIVYFKDEATTGLDVEYDARKKQNEINLNVATFNESAGSKFAINGLPLLNCEFVTKVDLTNTDQGSYKFTFADLQSLTLGYEVTLIDNFLQTSAAITEELEYDFAINTDALSGGADRFELKFTTATIKTTTPPSFTDLKECEPENVKVRLNAPQTGVKYQLWSGGGAITDEVNSTGSDITFVLSKEDLQQGTNLFTLKATTVDGCYNHDFNNALEYYFESPASVSSVENGENCGEGTVTLEASGAPSNGYYNWYETSDATEPVFTSEDATFVTPSLTKSKSYFVSVANGSGCESARSKVEANILYFDAPTIEVDGNTLMSSTGSAYQWYKNGEALTGKTSQVLQATESGDYAVTVTTLEGCSIASEAISFVVTGEADLIDMGVRVYPNPISSTLKITMPANFAQDVTKLSVFDIRGSEIASVTDKDVIDSGEVTIDFREKKSGQYILNIISGRKVIALRLVKR